MNVVQQRRHVPVVPRPPPQPLPPPPPPPPVYYEDLDYYHPVHGEPYSGPLQPIQPGTKNAYLYFKYALT